MKRCYSTLLPTSASYLTTHLSPAADLYGPFWTLTTLIFTLFLSSSLAASITAYLSAPGTEDFDYNFQLLSIAVTLVYAYGLALPVLLWLALRYMGVGEWSVIEALAVWGYGQFVWIPVSVRSISYAYYDWMSEIPSFPDTVCDSRSSTTLGFGRNRIRPFWLFPLCKHISNLGSRMFCW